MHRIVFLDSNTLRADIRRPAFAHEWTEHAETAPLETLERLRGATIAITNKVPLRETVLSQLPDLKFIAVAATGVDMVDLDYCKRRGLPVSNVRNYAPHAVPEHVFALILALRRNLFSYREELRAGAWQRARAFCLLDYPILELHESKLGIIGHGALGRAVERLARGFGMRTLVAEHKDAAVLRAGRTSFEETLRTSDILTLHCPLTSETRNLIGPRELGQMQPHALLINTARGGLVDEAALVAALRSRTIAGAGFDVLTREPPRDGNPLLELSLPNFILTPHVAWASREAMQTLADQLINNIEAFVAGRPQNLVS
ncbi:MAG: glycerate dehydrogenase [Blastocatellia bacterium]|jgi:glycerate dehydrogenase|nr:glycerate dehydrogenase [Blastocatellia bacterium]